MKIILGADHGGFQMKEKTREWLFNEKYEVVDVGAKNLEMEDDFVDYAKAAVNEILSPDDKLVLFCRNGFGMCIAANRFGKVRCGLAFDREAVRKGRLDDNINGLAIPTDYLSEEEIKKMIKIFLTSNFSDEEKYRRRLLKLNNIS